MKRFIFLLVTLMPVLVFAQKAKIDFTTTSHNFGTINENAGKATFDFSFKNTGNVPLILTNVRGRMWLYNTGREQRTGSSRSNRQHQSGFRSTQPSGCFR